MVVEMNGSHNPSPSALSLLAPVLIVSALGSTSGAQEQPPPLDEREALAGAPPGAWSREQRPAGWSVLETRSFELQSRLGKQPTAALAGHLDSLLELYRELLPSPAGGERLVVKLLADEDEYRAYVGPFSAGAVSGARFGRYDAGSGEVVAWNTRLVLGRNELATALRLDSDRVTTLTYGENQAVLQLTDAATRAYTPDLGAVLARCCWRQYLDRRVWPKGAPELPAWLVQGLAEHAATASADAQGRIRTGSNTARIRELGWMLVEGDTRPLFELLRPEPGTPAFDVGPAPPAQGWSLIHFLLTSDDPQRRQLLPRLLAEIDRTDDYERSAGTVFAEVDLERLHADWQAWAASLPVDDPLHELARRYGDKVRPEQLTGDADLKRRYSWLWSRRNAPQPENPLSPAVPRPVDPPSDGPPSGPPPDEHP